MQANSENTKRLGYPPSEFARLNGRHPTWGYRQLYSGRVKAITSMGRILIPASEVERVMGTAEFYNPKRRKRNAQDLKKKVAA
jgi:hypothetical protein